VRRESRPSTLLVPRAAVDLSGRAPQVRVTGGARKPVQLGPCNAQECVVTSGLAEGERVESIVEVHRG